MNIDRAADWASRRKHGTLITLRADGRAQSSDIVYRVVDGSFLISLTDGRAKTTNIRRDPRTVLHISAPDSWSYLSFDGITGLSAVTTEATDETSDALVDYYRTVAGEEHEDWSAYRQAMIDEKRLIATFTPGNVVGQINGD